MNNEGNTRYSFPRRTKQSEAIIALIYLYHDCMFGFFCSPAGYTSRNDSLRVLTPRDYEGLYTNYFLTLSLDDCFIIHKIQYIQ